MTPSRRLGQVRRDLQQGGDAEQEGGDAEQEAELGEGEPDLQQGGDAEYIHTRLIEQRSIGTATILISEDLDEVLGLADRVAVMYEGDIVAIVQGQDASREQIGLLMAGVVEQTTSS